MQRPLNLFSPIVNIPPTEPTPEIKLYLDNRFLTHEEYRSHFKELTQCMRDLEAKQENLETKLEKSEAEVKRLSNRGFLLGGSMIVGATSSAFMTAVPALLAAEGEPNSARQCRKDVIGPST